MTILNTARFNFPYPDDDEDADVPVDIQALAEAMEAALALVHDDLVPIGSMKIWPRVAPPDNWILCQGQSLLQSGIYNPLFVVIGTTFGSVDGTHFNLPDMRGRVPVGLDIGGGPMGTLADTLGEKYGSAAHTLVQAEIPLHSHPPDTGGTTFLVSNGTFPGSGGRIITNSPGGMHFTLDVTTDQYGGSGPHNNVQPSIALQYVIRFA